MEQISKGEAMKLLDYLEIPYSDQTDDYVMTCFWCGSEKMSVRKTDGNIFQCWKCKQSGNALTLLRKYYEDLPELTVPSAKIFTSRKKGVMPFVMRHEGIRYDHRNYFWFPVYNSEGNIIALHKYSPKTNIAYASPKPWSCSVLGINQLNSSSEIWIAEGHADYLIMRQTFLQSETECPDLLGTCGSGFSSTYLHLLADKKVVLLFDNDEAGRTGVESVARRIKTSGTSVESLHFLDWSKVRIPDTPVIPAKFDIRDLANALKG